MRMDDEAIIGEARLRVLAWLSRTPLVAVESHAIYSRLLIEDARPLPEAIKTVLEQQGKPDLPLDRVVDATVVQEVLRERR